MTIKIILTHEVNPNAVCAKYWRKCTCGESVHMGFKCSCGGNPWNITNKKINDEQK